MINRSRKNKLDKLLEARKVPPENRFINNEHFSVEWCLKKIESVEGNDYNDKHDIFRCK